MSKYVQILDIYKLEIQFILKIITSEDWQWDNTDVLQLYLLVF